MTSPINDPRHPWSRLTAAARTVRDDRDTAAPYGFATRVAALALGRERKMVSLFDVFALRALGVACLLAIFSVVVNFGELSRRLSGSPPASTLVEDVLPPVQDATAVVLALSD